mmetsp:Transcript_18344/g.56901  ORF Transcript_18344/g.56901 Transcript_18344/m.56901 type:complete len:290 (-) Transcript_18344:690-1559(-)
MASAPSRASSANHMVTTSLVSISLSLPSKSTLPNESVLSPRMMSHKATSPSELAVSTRRRSASAWYFTMPGPPAMVAAGERCMGAMPPPPSAEPSALLRHRAPWPSAEPADDASMACLAAIGLVPATNELERPLPGDERNHLCTLEVGPAAHTPACERSTASALIGCSLSNTTALSRVRRSVRTQRPSRPPLMTLVQFGSATSAHTLSLCTASVCEHRRCRRSHSRTVASLPPLSAIVPSALSSKKRTLSWWPVSSMGLAFASRASHSRTTLSVEPVATSLPAPSIATA